jgi:hypothetical protein
LIPSEPIVVFKLEDVKLLIEPIVVFILIREVILPIIADRPDNNRDKAIHEKARDCISSDEKLVKGNNG